jgi:predicted Fe-S protein YdhL (DUF1289 family)
MIVTPCISVCKLDPITQKCSGCNRTAEQIRMWSRYTDEQRLAIMRELGYGIRMSREEYNRRYDKG